MSDLLISFSGGKTSAFMTKIIKTFRPDAKVLFANTGAEHPETYKFIENIQKFWGIDITFIECVVTDEMGKGTTYKEVSFADLNRTGQPFYDVSAKYGIPNKGYPHCTNYMKIIPIHAWAKGNLSKDYKTAIGIRADEIDRMAADKDKKRFIYPLVNLGITKEVVNSFWQAQPFNLNIPEKYGNCVTCWKKSDKKLAEIMRENPHYFDLFDDVEKKHKLAREYRGEQYFFRGHRSVEDLRKEFNQQMELSDVSNGCEESCEVF